MGTNVSRYSCYICPFEINTTTVFAVQFFQPDPAVRSMAITIIHSMASPAVVTTRLHSQFVTRGLPVGPPEGEMLEGTTTAGLGGLAITDYPNGGVDLPFNAGGNFALYELTISDGMLTTRHPSHGSVWVGCRRRQSDTDQVQRIGGEVDRVTDATRVAVSQARPPRRGIGCVMSCTGHPAQGFVANLHGSVFVFKIYTHILRRYAN